MAEECYQNGIRLAYTVAVLEIPTGGGLVVVWRRVARILLMAGVITGLLLLGWGIRSWAGFFESFARGAFVVVMVTAMATLVVSIQNPAQKGTRTPPGQVLVLSLVQLITVPLLIFLPYADRRALLVIHADWVRWLGLTMTMAGHVITILAIRTLGRNYSVYVTIQQQHHLVQNGIYGAVRHPIYLGMLLMWPGACLVFRSWLAVPVFAFFLVFAVLRGAQEERVLREEFSEQFEAYCHRTWRIVPHLY